MDPPSNVKPDARRGLPSVDRLARQVREMNPEIPKWAVSEGAREAIARARAGSASDLEGAGGLSAAARAIAADLAAPHPRRVVNATGVVLHTNLGRAPLAAGAAEAAARASSGYSDLELDLATGRRGNRHERVARKLVSLSGAESATVCNNNAAALLLALDTLGRGREVVVSRGELVEIGGSFRVPDIMQRAGVRLVEVGTTNRTHARDYEGAIGPETALLLKVHRSNFEQSGFVAEVGLGELARIGSAHGLPVVEDLGSATLVDLREHGFPAEAFAPSRLAQGADLVCFSGDKLLGGPQAGLVIGRAEIVAEMRSNPLARALRLDKLSLAALDWTLAALLEGRAHSELPVLRQLLAPSELLEARARSLAEALASLAKDSLQVGAQAERSAVGGGSLPGFELDTWVVVLTPTRGADALAAALRHGPVPVIGRVRDGCVLLDVRTLLDGDETLVREALQSALD